MTRAETPHFYGRRRGRKLRVTMQQLLDTRLPELRLDPAASPASQFNGAPEDLFLEIGFGGGEHLAARAQQNPDCGFIGCEPYINGVAMLLGKIRAAGVTNIRIYPRDARHIFDVLPEASIERAFLLYPDPWPKKRHHRRRFVTPEHLAPLARVLKSSALFRVATDIPDYVRQTLQQVPKQGFDWLAENPENWRHPWVDWHSTRYEQKALRENRVPHYLTFRKH